MHIAASYNLGEYHHFSTRNLHGEVEGLLVKLETSVHILAGDRL